MRYNFCLTNHTRTNSALKRDLVFKLDFSLMLQNNVLSSCFNLFCQIYLFIYYNYINFF